MVNKLSSFKFIPFVILIGYYLFRHNPTDYTYFLIWWAAFVILGLMFLPTADLIFSRFSCRGYMFAKVLGLAVAGWLQWMLSSLHILPFQAWACYVLIIILFAGNVVLNKKTKTYQKYVTDNELFKSSVNKETLFLILLMFWTYLRALRPEIEGLEKFMEFGFINSILRNDYMPAPDMWLSGESINYYYLGHFFSAYMTRLTNIHPAITYNLMMASLFAISFMLAYSIGTFLVQFYIENSEKQITQKKQKTAQVFAGLLTGAVVTLAGNLHSMIYGILFPHLNPDGRTFYWFPDATRYIGFNPKVEGDGTIHEFPLYSYVVSDLHAHVINMIFVLTAIGALCAIAAHLLKLYKENDEIYTQKPLEFIKQWICPGYFILMLLVGLFTGMNFWDFPIYVVVTGAVLLYVNLKAYFFSSKSIWMTAVQMAAVAVCAYILVLPFHISFDSMAAAINFTKHRSLWYQLLVLWGFQLFFGISLTAAMISRYKRSGKKKLKGEPDNTLLRYIGRANPADAIATIFFICATGLFIIPEIIYVVDIYGSQPRANTMFKFGYQAFILFGIGVGYSMIRLFLEEGRKFKLKPVLITLGVVLLGSAFVYPFFAIPGWYGGGREYQGLDGTTYMITEKRDYKTPADNMVKVNMTDDHALVQYINENISGSPTLVEAIANGNDSYTINGRISANTGLPNIINWYWHEYLWRNSNGEMLNVRRDDTNEIYMSGDADTVGALLKKYDVRYIVIGEIERLRYPGLNEALLQSFGEIVFRSNELYMVEIYG